MPAGFVISKWSGVGGRIFVPGLGAVLATLDSWTLVRREDTLLESPVWDLRGVFSYVNPVLIRQPGLAQRMEIKASKVTYEVIFDHDALKVDGLNFTITGATLNVRD